MLPKNDDGDVGGGGFKTAGGFLAQNCIASIERISIELVQRARVLLAHQTTDTYVGVCVCGVLKVRYNLARICFRHPRRYLAAVRACAYSLVIYVTDKCCECDARARQSATCVFARTASSARAESKITENERERGTERVQFSLIVASYAAWPTLME